MPVQDNVPTQRDFTLLTQETLPSLETMTQDSSTDSETSDQEFVGTPELHASAKIYRYVDAEILYPEEDQQLAQVYTVTLYYTFPQDPLHRYIIKTKFT